MAPIIALTVVVIIFFLLFQREIAGRDLSPIILFLLVITLVMLTEQGGKTVQLGPALWGNYWLPQMLGLAILFLIYMTPGPRLLAILKDKKTSYQALTTTLIGILVCVLIGLVTMTVSSRVTFW